MGKVVHFEIPTDDLERAKAFYARVFDWQLDTIQMPGGGDYTGATTTPVDETMMPTNQAVSTAPWWTARAATPPQWSPSMSTTSMWP